MSQTLKTIGILGAGVAGLVTAKTLKQYGFEVTVFEAKPELGGVWANNYRTLRVLEPRSVYGLPDWPWPKGTPLYPPAANVRAYLNDYAKHFGISDRIQFNSRVLNAAPRDTGGWQLQVESQGAQTSHEFDAFVMAPGMFNIPKIPSWAGNERFQGNIIHTSQYRDIAQVENKDVVIVGFSRSAMDVAVDISEHAHTVTIVHRSVRWPVPEKILGLIRNHALLFARWPTLFAPPWIRPSRTVQFLHDKGAASVRFFWKFFEVLLNAQFKLKRRGLTPDGFSF